jgi:ABC-type branched-subunit amino acid transport system substrate-binding protein
MLAFDEVNAKGGINGIPLRLVSRDDGRRVEDTVRLVKEVIAKESPVALLGLSGAANVEALAKDGVLEASGIAALGVSSGANSFRNHPNVFHIRASHRQEIVKSVEQIAVVGLQRVAVLYEEGTFGQEGLAAATAALQEKKLTLAARVAHAPSSLDFAAAATQIAAIKPQAVLVLSHTAAAAAFLKAYSAAGGQAQMFMLSVVEAEQLVTAAGVALARGTAIAQVMPSPYRATQKVAADLRRTAKNLGIDAARVNFASMEGYIAGRTLVEALKRSGSGLIAGAAGREAVRRNLMSMKGVEIGDFALDFTPANREGSSYVDLSVINAQGRVSQ